MKIEPIWIVSTKEMQILLYSIEPWKILCDDHSFERTQKNY